jgi:hypothetical protein
METRSKYEAGLAKNFPSRWLSRRYASSVAARGDSTKRSQAVRHTTLARSVSNHNLARRSRARVMLETHSSSQVSENSNKRRNRTIFEKVAIRLEDTDVLLQTLGGGLTGLRPISVSAPKRTRFCKIFSRTGCTTGAPRRDATASRREKLDTIYHMKVTLSGVSSNAPTPRRVTRALR